MMEAVTGGHPDCVVVFGAAEFNGHRKHGWKPAPTKAFRTFLVQHGVKVLLMDEYMTSQVHHFPAAQLKASL